MLHSLSTEVRQYLIVTGNYWAFTLTDGALRMLVVLHFNQLGYSPLEIALLFLFYEFFGVVTNLVGGWLGARVGLNRTMNMGLLLQVLALAMLLVPAALLTVPWVMAAQALSGIAKDLNKMSAKSTIKLLVSADAHGTLFRWVALLTGSKNALKGAGFFLGGVLLAWLGFQGAIGAMTIALTVIWCLSVIVLKRDLGRSRTKPRFRDVFSKSRAVNVLSAARLCLFAARDIWFVVALPVYLSQVLDWSSSQTGGFMAIWVMAYGLVQALAPRFMHRDSSQPVSGRAAMAWAALLTLVPALIALGLNSSWPSSLILVAGLMIFGVLFALNSSLHSFLIVSYADRDNVSMDVGFYYMSNAMGRLLGTVLSGWVFQAYGLGACLVISSVLLLMATLISVALPR